MSREVGSQFRSSLKRLAADVTKKWAFLPCVRCGHLKRRQWLLLVWRFILEVLSHCYNTSQAVQTCVFTVLSTNQKLCWVVLNLIPLMLSHFDHVSQRVCNAAVRRGHRYLLTPLPEVPLFFLKGQDVWLLTGNTFSLFLLLLSTNLLSRCGQINLSRICNSGQENVFGSSLKKTSLITHVQDFWKLV